MSILVRFNTLVHLNIALGTDFEVDCAIDPYGSMTVLTLMQPHTTIGFHYTCDKCCLLTLVIRPTYSYRGGSRIS